MTNFVPMWIVIFAFIGLGSVLSLIFNNQNGLLYFGFLFVASAIFLNGQMQRRK